MNIKAHIEAGHYPTDEKGRALVPMKNGATVIVYATDAPCVPEAIVGYRRNFGPCTWSAEGHWHTSGGGYSPNDLLPPAPRKVAVKAWALNNIHGAMLALTDDPVRAKSWPTVGVGYFAVALSGEYEEPWS